MGHMVLLFMVLLICSFSSMVLLPYMVVVLLFVLP